MSVEILRGSRSGGCVPAEAADLRARIRSYEITCRCSVEERGFRVVGNPPHLMYDGKRPQSHAQGCEWAGAVARIYELERKLER